MPRRFPWRALVLAGAAVLIAASHAGAQEATPTLLPGATPVTPLDAGPPVTPRDPSETEALVAFYATIAQILVTLAAIVGALLTVLAIESLNEERQLNREIAAQHRAAAAIGVAIDRRRATLADVTARRDEGSRAAMRGLLLGRLSPAEWEEERDRVVDETEAAIRRRIAEIEAEQVRLAAIGDDLDATKERLDELRGRVRQLAAVALVFAALLTLGGALPMVRLLGLAGDAAGAREILSLVGFLVLIALTFVGVTIGGAAPPSFWEKPLVARLLGGRRPTDHPATPSDREPPEPRS